MQQGGGSKHSTLTRNVFEKDVQSITRGLGSQVLHYVFVLEFVKQLNLQFKRLYALLAGSFEALRELAANN